MVYYLKNFSNSRPSASNFKSFSRSLGNFFSQLVRTILVTKYHFQLTKNIKVSLTCRKHRGFRRYFGLKYQTSSCSHQYGTCRGQTVVELVPSNCCNQVTSNFCRHSWFCLLLLIEKKRFS